MTAELLGTRLETLRAMRCAVLPLVEALTRLRRGDLPRRSVAITFDDGTYDFCRQAYPRLKKCGFPGTVYRLRTTLNREIPVFNLMCSYIFGRAWGAVRSAPELGRSAPMVCERSWAGIGSSGH